MLYSTLLWVARLLIAFEIVVALIPLLPVGFWAVRLCDAPRVQALMLLIIPTTCVSFLLISDYRRAENLLLCSLILFVIAWQAWHVVPYTPLYPREVADASNQQPSTVRLLIANVEKGNRQFEEVANVIKRLDPEMVVILEINDAWNEGLSEIKRTFPHHVGVVRSEGLGIELWSKLKLQQPQVRYLVSDKRASILTDVIGNDGNVFRMIAIHPTPPGLLQKSGDERHDSRIRDAELSLVARQVAQGDSVPWLVTGDFNDVAWSHTTRLFARVSGLKDPRIGRKLMNTYNAKYLLWRFPIDQVYCSQDTTVHEFDRVQIPGSDHFGVFVELSLPRSANNRSEASSNDKQETNELIREGQQDANDE